MGATFNVDDGTVTITFSWPGIPTTKAQNTVNAAAERMWNEGYGDHGTEEEPRVFADTTNQERVNMLYAFCKKAIVRYANEHYKKIGRDTGEATAAAEAETMFNLEAE